MSKANAFCCLALLAPGLVCGVAGAAEQRYPSKPIRFIIPTAPGGGSDLVARMLGQKFTAVWGQQVVLDHRPGAGMTIGIDLAAKAAPDGYTLVLVNPSHAINATLMPKLPYDPVRDLTPITVVATQPYGMVVSQQLPAKSVKDVIALAKAKPREVNYASSGNGSASHLAAIKSDDMIDMLARAGTEPLGNTPREAADFLKVEIARWGKVIRQANVKVE